MALRNLDEGVRLAVDSLRTNKLRSFLTILGVVIGVSTVMAMASIVQGIQTQIFNVLNAAVPNTFYVFRFFAQTPLNPDNLPYEVRIRPIMSEEDAAAVNLAPGVRHAALWTRTFGRFEREGIRSQSMQFFGADDRFMAVQGGTLARGRMFTPAEMRSGTNVVVLETEIALTLFGSLDPIGGQVKIRGKVFRVIGIWDPPQNIFRPPGVSEGGIMPYRTVRSSFPINETNDLFIIVLGDPGIGIGEIKDNVTVALRRSRSLRPGMPNTFDMLTQDQLLEIVNKLTSAFFLVMVALSGVALLVGGIGVMAIMMVSVTNRTREIGTRKALGATRREILWQFLVEAATLTLIGGLIGIMVGLAAGQLLKFALRIDSGVPVWSAVVATLVSVGIGLTFGLYPANRAAQMDPVEALRHE